MRLERLEDADPRRRGREGDTHGNHEFAGDQILLLISDVELLQGQPAGALAAPQFNLSRHGNQRRQAIPYR